MIFRILMLVLAVMQALLTGITDYDLEDFVQRFPAPDDPQGSCAGAPMIKSR